MKTPKQLRRDIQDLTTHLAQVQAGLERRSSIKVAKIGKECQRSATTLAQLLQLVPTEYKVAVVGRFKAGKSSFVNELLPNRLASEGTLPETAAVTTFRHGQNVRASIRFVNSAVWGELQSLYAENPKHADAHRVRSWESFLVFAPQFLKGALQLSLVEPHLSKPNQLRNLQEFLMHVADVAKPKAIEVITSPVDKDTEAQQERLLATLTKDFFNEFGVALTLRQEAGLHDRHLRLNHGVLFKLGRGLDVYKPATGLAIHRPSIRRVRASEVDVFVVPGHALAPQPGATNA